MSFFGWMTKGHCDVTLLDSMTALVEIFAVVGVVSWVANRKRR